MGIRILSLLIQLTCVTVAARSQQISLTSVGGTSYARTGDVLPDGAIRLLGENTAEGLLLSIDASQLPESAGRIQNVFLNFYQAGINIRTLDAAHKAGPEPRNFRARNDQFRVHEFDASFDIRLDYRINSDDSFNAGDVSEVLITGASLHPESFRVGTARDPALRMAVRLRDSGMGDQPGLYRNTVAVPEAESFSLMLALTPIGIVVLWKKRKPTAEALNTADTSCQNDQETPL